MKKLLLPLLTILLPGLIFTSCNNHKRERINPAFREYIQAFTAGPVSVADPIRIRMSNEFVDESMVNTEIKDELISFSPNIRGKLSWSDTRTLEFKPENKLPPGQKFKAVFHLSKLITLPDSLSDFAFSFTTIVQDFEVLVENHKAYSSKNLSRERLYGRIITSDIAVDADLEKILFASQDGKDLGISWIHDGKNKKHYFQVDSIQRSGKKSEVKLRWNGNEIVADKIGEQVFEIVPAGTFAYTGAKVVQGEERYILVQFSDPLDEDQNLNGLVTINRKSDLRYSVEDNELRIYPQEMKKEVMLSIDAGLKNINGRTLHTGINEKIAFEDTRPAVRFPGQGVIMPVSEKIMLPFEAVNVKAVDLKIIKIYENNILQFMQVNDLAGQSELARVGKVVVKKTIPLKDVADYSRWNSYSIDLSELIIPEEGALYCIRLNIKKKYSTYPCGATADNSTTDMISYGDIAKEESQGWYYYGSYEDNNYNEDGEYDYDWNERDNPCKNYYYYNKSVTKNVLASNLGIIAKSGDLGQVMVVVTDLLTAKPVKDANIEFYNLQQQKIGSALSDGEGASITILQQKPYVVVVKKDKQVGYLKMQEGKSLSLSMFDAGGEQVQKGIKGYLYGDRGVWRPGDSLYLTFILADKQELVPENHPVTFMLSNPAGQLISKITRTSSEEGFYNFSTSTTPDAPTGNWTAVVKIGNAEFRKSLKIETVKPNRLKINLDFGSQKLFKGKEYKGTIRSSWLTGAIAKNLRTTVNLTLTDAGTSFPKYPGYTFSNPSSSFTSEKMTVFEGKLNEEGIVSFSPDIKMTTMAPGILRAAFETTIYEEGGDFSIDKFIIPYYPFSTFAGVNVAGESGTGNMLYTGRDYKINLINVDQDGNLVKSNNIRVELLKLDWRWWWDDSGEDRSGFISTSYSSVTDSSTVSISNGKGTFILNKDEDDWGRYFIRITDKRSGHVAGKEIYIDWYGESHAPGGQKQSAAMLTFSCDKEKYKPGDKVKLTIPSPDNGRALLTIENGTGILESYWFNTSKGNTEYEFSVTPEMAPNCYAYITLVQPHAQVANDLPVRLYGVIPIMVEDPASRLSPKIIMKDVIRPEENVSITVKEEHGVPMTYTLAVVDEGLLDLTRFKTPDPWEAFNAREASGVKTWDLYDDVMGAWSGEFQRILSIGGDKDGVNKGALKANRFKPVVKFFGPYGLGRKGSKTHTFKMPQYVGSVRVMVVAGNRGAYGNAEKTVAVRKPLMVQGTMPRTLCPDETVSLPVTVFAMEKGIRDVTVKIAPNNLFTVSGSATKQVKFTSTGDQVVYFLLKVKNITGTGKISISAISGNEKAQSDIELDVRNPGVAVSAVTEAVIKPGTTWEGSYSLPGMAGTNKGAVEVYSIMPLNLEKRLGYLVTYPHGCLEQITSGAFPQLFLADLVDLNEQKTKETESNIKAAIQKIISMQISNGGLTLWPGSPYADDWTTSYAGHFILEAKQKGYTIPVGFFSSWKNFQKEKATSWKFNESAYNNDLMQAYRLYTLALAGSPETGSMNRMLERKNLSSTASWTLAAAFQLAGKPEAAIKLISSANTKISPYLMTDFTYGSEVRDKSMIIQTLLLMNRMNDAAALVKEVAGKLASGDWMSTQTTSFALLAISKFTGGTKGKELSASVKINGGKEENVKTSKAMSSIVMNVKDKSGKGNVTIKNTSSGIITARIITTGIPPVGDASSSFSNLNMTVKYTSGDGKVIDPGSITMGTTFYAEITVTNPGSRGFYRQMALTQVVASGWEIINSRMSDFAAAGTEANFEYQDIRDDRVLTYFDLPEGKSKTFRIMLNASYQGKFYLAPVYCEAMYDNSIYAKLPGQWTNVTEPGK